MPYTNFLYNINKYWLAKQMDQSADNIYKQTLSKDDPLNIQSIKKAIKLAEDNITLKEETKNNVIFWGYSGAGKSSSVIILNGQQIYGYRKGGFAVVHNLRDDSQEVELKDRLNKGQVTVFIEEKVTAGTVFPCSLKMQNSVGQEMIILWDTPGFGDNKGLTQNLINTYYIHRLFSIQKQVKLVFTMNCQDLASSERAGKFEKIISSFVNGLKNFQNYQNSVAILVTKCNLHVTEQDIYDLLKENTDQLLKMNSTNENINFLKLLNSKKLKFLLIRQPDLPGNINRNNSIVVTHQYKQFKQEFYSTILKLKPAKVPKLQSPQMTSDDLNQCIYFANDIFKNFRRDSDEMALLLEKYYVRKFSEKIKFTDNNEQVKKLLQYLDNISKCFSELHKTTIIAKQFTQTLIGDLGKIFKDQRMLFQVKNNICYPLQTISNFLIISNFIESINIPLDRNPSTLKKLLAILQNTLVNSMSRIKKMKDAYFLQAQKNYEQFLRRKFSQNLGRWRNQVVYKKWLQNIRPVPYLFLKISKFSDKSNVSSLIKTVQGLQKQSGMQCQEELTPLLQIHKSQMQRKLFSISEKSVVQNIINSEVIPRQNQLRQDTQFEKWEEKRLEKINFNLPQNTYIEMMSKLRCDVDQREKNIEAKNNEIRDLKQKNHKYKRGCCQKCCCTVM